MAGNTNRPRLKENMKYWKIESDGPKGCKEFYIVDDSGRRIATLSRMDIGPKRNGAP